KGAWPHDHLSGHSGRGVAGRTARASLADPPGEPSCDDGRSTPRGTLRPDVRRRAHANRPRAAERAGLRQEECSDLYSVGQSGPCVCGCSRSTNLTFHLTERTGVKNMTVLRYVERKRVTLGSPK